MLWAMIKKEFLLVFRDKHALLALFVMPAIFILIMSVALKEQFNQDAISFSVVVVDNAKTKQSRSFIKALHRSKSFHSPLSTEEPQFTLSIPKAYFNLHKKTPKLEIKIEGSMKSDLLEVLKAKLLKEVLSQRLKKMSREIKKESYQASKALKNISLEYEKLFSIEYTKSRAIPSSTQQSVPSWIVFGMFFVIIPMSSIFINERKQNTLARLSSMNISIFKLTLAKTTPYLIINHIQVWIMLCVGIFVVPYFETPALEITGSFLALELLSFSLSLCAIGLSTLIAVNATSSEQATTIGGILNILLGAIGGIMVPKFIMPKSMQELSNLSPMGWGLDGFLEIFLESGDVSMVADESLMLMGFGVTLLLISMIILKLRVAKGL